MHVNVHAWGSNFDRLADQVRAMMDEMDGPKFFRSHAADTWRPRVNLYETRERFVVCVELAGMTAEKIDVRVDRGVLHVAGVRNKPLLPDGPMDVGVHLMEIDSGRFHRKITLPEEVVVEKITAAYRQGYLWIDLPRSAGSSG